MILINYGLLKHETEALSQVLKALKPFFVLRGQLKIPLSFCVN